MTEAWMLADANTLCEVLEANIKPHELGLPKKAKQVELYANSKQTLKESVQRAYAHKSRRQRPVNLDFLYEPLARAIDLGRLDNVPAYQRFVIDLTSTLHMLGFI